MQDLKKLYILIIVCLILGLGLFILSSYISNGYESLAMLYLKSDGVIISKSLDIQPNESKEIEVKAAGFNKQINDYTVRIVPNTESDFEYTVDDVVYNFGDIEDLTECFDIDIRTNSFTLNCRKMTDLLKLYHGGAEITLSDDITENTEYFILVVERDDNTIVINLHYYLPVENVDIDRNKVIF